jgi:hypothetical protein
VFQLQRSQIILFLSEAFSNMKAYQTLQGTNLTYDEEPEKAAAVPMTATKVAAVNFMVAIQVSVNQRVYCDANTTTESFKDLHRFPILNTANLVRHCSTAFSTIVPVQTRTIRATYASL